MHLAAQSGVRPSLEDPAKDADINVMGTLNVLECSVRSGVRKVVYAASGGTLYGEPKKVPVKESSAASAQPQSPYGISKKVALQYLSFYQRYRGLDFSALALGNVYGPRQDPHGEAGVVAIFFGRVANGQELHVFGDGRQTRDYVFAADVVAATLAAASGPAGVYNVGTATETSVLELAEGCKRASGVDAEIVFDPPRLGELSRSVLDPSRAESALGWRPATSLDEGLAATWKFVQAAEGEGGTGAN